MENEDKDEGYPEEEEGEQCQEFAISKSIHNEKPMDFDERSMDIRAYDNTIDYGKITPDILFNYANSSMLCYKETAARRLYDALESAVSFAEAYSEQDGVEKVFECMRILSENIETSIRCIVVSSLPKIAIFCASYDSPLMSLKHLVESDILPIVLKAIADEDRRLNIRKEGYNALKRLQEANLVDQVMIEDKIDTIRRDIINGGGLFRHYIAAGNFIAKMAPVVGEAATETLLLPQISNFCKNRHAKVREACVHYLIDIACHVNSLITENIIIPLFIKLSEDHVDVRKACVENIVILSCLCLMESRKTVLSQAYFGFLTDPVTKDIACKQLGAFITTFAQPALAALGSNRNGDYLLINDKGSFFQFASRHPMFPAYEQEITIESVNMLFVPMEAEPEGNTNTAAITESAEANEDLDNNGVIDIEHFLNSIENEGNVLAAKKVFFEESDYQTLTDANSNPIDGDSRTANDCKTHFANMQYENQPDLVQSCLSKSASIVETTNHRSIEASSTDNISELPDNFNSFQYWRDPIPEFSELDMDSGKRENIFRFRKNMRTRYIKKDSNRRDIECVGNELVDSSTIHFDHSFAIAEEKADMIMIECNKQCVIPQILLDTFVSMSQMSFIELKMSCAYSFPAVMLTLGRQNWPFLKHAYFNLASASEKKLRELIARSIHEIALILGSELTTEDLIPIYNALINDVEDVRVTALNHLSCFVKLLKPNGRCMFLPHLTDYMMIDYSWNWRFRKQLSEQLIEMMDYFVPSDCWKFVSPVAFALLMDRVAAVRLQALSLVTNLIRVVSADITLLRGILAELAEQFAHSTQWARRQSFAFLCSSLMQTPVLSEEMFARDVLPHLLDLSWDTIPNVRIAVARTLSSDVITHPYFCNVGSPHYDVLMQVLKRLCKDEDRDVKYFASLNSCALPQFCSYENTRSKSERW